MTNPTIEVTRCLHTAIAVTDLEKAAYFYGEILGLEKVDRVLKFPGIWYQVGEYQIHLIGTTDQSATLLPEKWGRGPHMAFTVSDLEAVKTRLQAEGCPLQLSASGRAALFVCDPDGNVIELQQCEMSI